jgi:hypothetical protein
MGYDVDRVVVVGANLRGVELGRNEGLALMERALAALKAVPGVVDVTVAAAVPFLTNETRGLYVPGVDSISRRGMFLLQVGSPSYFATMGTRILRGRGFDQTDQAGGARVVVVSEGMARAIWQEEDAIGKCLHIGGLSAPCSTVIGVAEETRLRSLISPREFAYYVPAAQFAEAFEPMWFARVEGPPAAFADDIRLRLQRELPGAAYAMATPLETLVDPQRRSWQFGATMFVAFGGLALVLAAVGLYSLIAYDVAQRTQELGVRLALGASAANVIGLVVVSGVRVVLVGIALGGGLALWGSRFMEGLMFRQSPRDPAVFGAVALVLLVVALVASAGPALRASRVDPNIALRGG